MYASAGHVWNSLAKNATEGLASRSRIVPVTLLLLLGQVVPFAIAAILLPSILLLFLLASGTTMSGGAILIIAIVVLAMVAAWLPRWLGVARFRQDWRSALLHPLGMLLLLSVQWYALFRKMRGGAVSWRGRSYTAE